MKTKLSEKKPATISQLCGQPEKTFQRLLDQKDAALERMNKEVDTKTKAALARQCGWATAA
jgi:hypothetical protein